MPAKGDSDPAVSDAGVDDNGNGGNSGGDGEGSTAGGTNGGSGNQDAGAPPSRDASVQDPGACPWSTVPNDAGMGAATCAGTHCALTRSQLVSATGSACEASDSLDAICSGDSLRVVNGCWRANLSAPDRATLVKSCAAADPTLAKLDPGCLDCYVALHECLSTSCAVECAAEGSTSCEPCANQKCVPGFATCSGIATP